MSELSPSPSPSTGAADKAPAGRPEPAAGWALEPEEPCSIEGLNNKVFSGRLTSFDADAGVIQVRVPPARTPATLRFSQFRRLTLTRPIDPPDSFDPQRDAEYHVLMEGGQVLSGRTAGHVESEIGLFLFPSENTSGASGASSGSENRQVSRLFCPRAAYSRVDFGPRLGEVLVEQAVVTPGQIEAALLEQQHIRKQRLGEALVELRVITSEQLEEALAVQKSMPLLRLGEALVSLLHINKESLTQALKTQAKNRGMPLGELLVRDGLISREELEEALNQKRAAYPHAGPEPTPDIAASSTLDKLRNPMDDTITPAQISLALAEQERQRDHKLGEVLLSTHIVRPEQLTAALQAQSRMPMVRIGEALVSLGFINEPQLFEALRSQGKDRSVPLGELLVRQGLITRQDLSTALARKMGYPTVDIDAFPIDVEALKRLPINAARRLEMLPLIWIAGKMVVALEDPSRRDRIDEAEFLTQCKLVPVLPAKADLQGAISQIYSKHGVLDAAAMTEAESAMTGGMNFQESSALFGVNELDTALDEQEIEGMAAEQADNLLVRFINWMIVEAYTQNVSDIHIEALPGRDKVRIRFRIDGAMQPFIELPHSYRQALISRLKIMCDLDISERRRPQDGKINFARFVPSCPIELRVALIPTNNGLEDAVLRILASAKPLPIDSLGMSPYNLSMLKAAVSRPYGMVLCVGPTGSGKTTTLHSALSYVNTPERKIWTAEDPVEITQAGLRQVQVNPKIDWTFAKALRAFLRADPDVIMVGEIRDSETAQIAVESSLTGHLVLSTLHTNSAAETITRLLDMGMDPFNFADSLLAVLAQRLVRRICSACRVSTPATDEQADELVRDYLHVWHDHPQTPSRDTVLADWLPRFGVNGRLQMWHGAGCDKCKQTGLKGRAGVHELLHVSKGVRRLIQTRARAEEIQELAMGEGLRTLRQDGIEKVLAGVTTMEEVRATSNV